MDGFKNTTKTSYDTSSGRKFASGGMTVSRNDMPGGQGPMNKPAMVAKYAKGGSVKKADQKIGRVMTEFTEGKLHSGSKKGPEVKNPKQAVAIAMSEARKAGAKMPMKKAMGGGVNSKLGKAIENAKAAMTATPRAKSTLVDRLPKNSLQKPSSGNPLMGGSVRDKPMSGRPDKAAPTMVAERSVGLSHEQMDAMRKREDAAYQARIASGEYSVKPTPPMPPKAPSSGNPLMGGMNRGDIVASKPTPVRGPSMSPAFNDRPMVRRKTGGLAAMPKGKC